MRPVWLDSDLKGKAMLAPRSLYLAEGLREVPVARMRLPGGAAPGIGDWVRLGNGLGLWRVRRRETEGRETVLELEHGIGILRDTLLTAGFAVTGDPAESMRRMLAVQTHLRGGQPWWMPGSCTLPAVPPHSVAWRSALAGIQGMLEDGNGQWHWNQSGFPWVLSLSPLPEGYCRCSAGRNLISARYSADGSGIVTRLYPHGSGGLTLPEGYVQSGRTEQYGVRGGVYRNSDLENTIALRAGAEAALAETDHPAESAEVEALLLDTGEEMDDLALGKRCRVWDGQHSLTGRILRVVHPDLIAQPRRVTLTVGPAPETVAESLRGLQHRVASLERENMTA